MFNTLWQHGTLVEHIVKMPITYIEGANYDHFGVPTAPPILSYALGGVTWEEWCIFEE